MHGSKKLAIFELRTVCFPLLLCYCISVEKQTFFLSISVHYLGKKNLTIFGDCWYGPADFLRKLVLDRFVDQPGQFGIEPAQNSSRVRFNIELAQNGSRVRFRPETHQNRVDQPVFPIPVRFW